MYIRYVHTGKVQKLNSYFLIDECITHSALPLFKTIWKEFFQICMLLFRFSQPPADLWDWYEPFLEDEEVGTVWCS